MDETGEGTGTSPADVYETFFGPAVLNEWAGFVASEARARTGMEVLDVACGTGILARALVDQIGPEGRLCGIDASEMMLAVARREAPEIEWQVGRAESLPFESGSFDRVVSQFGLMFFTDRTKAIREMMRVLRPGGRLTVAVWDAAENYPADFLLAGWLRQHYGDDVTEEFLAPHVLGNPDLLAELFAGAGVDGAEVSRREGTLRVPSLREWLRVELREFLLGDRIDDVEFERLVAEANTMFRPYLTAEGSAAFPAPGYVATAQKR